MIAGLAPVPIWELRDLESPRVWTVDGYLNDLPSLTPVRGTIQAEHRGNVLAVHGSLQTIVTLICDRCLNQFNQQLISTTEELIWLGEEFNDHEQLQASDGSEQMTGLLERLDPQGPFDPQQWAFEHLNLQLPAVNRCGGDCPGPPGLSTSGSEESLDSGSDPRWDVLKQLQMSDPEQPDPEQP